jgi:hypothetical protein
MRVLRVSWLCTWWHCITLGRRHADATLRIHTVYRLVHSTFESDSDEGHLRIITHSQKRSSISGSGGTVLV